MSRLKVLFAVLVVAAIGCAGYAFHLHLTEAPTGEVLLVAMLTLGFGIAAAIVGALESRVVGKGRHRGPKNK